MVLVARSLKNRKRKARIIAISVIASVFIAGVIASFIALGYYVAGLETIFPNVWAEGIDMTGMSVEQAEQELIISGYEENAAEISITVNFPYDTSFTITGNDVGLTLNASQAAQLAYDFGRTGSFIQNTFTYIKAFLGKTELNELSVPEYNTEPIRDIAIEYTKKFNDALYDNNLEVDDRQIIIIKGSSYAAASDEEVYNLAEHTMRRAIEQNTHLSIDFLPEASSDDTLDVLQSIFEYIHTEPVSSVYDKQRGNPRSDKYDEINLGATESSRGQTFDLPAAKELYSKAQNGETVKIPIIVLEPELSQTELKNMLYRDILGERTAYQSSNANRTTNIRLASEAIDGYVLQPGESFSYNEVVGRRTAERGYKEANAILYGVLTPELGGGVCQVSSAIYAALLFTDDITYLERVVHGLRVGYLPGGQDATVSYGHIDFRFRNDSEFPIKLEVTTSGTVTVDVKIYGTRTNDVYYKLESVLKETIPMETSERPVTPEDGLELAPGERKEIAKGNDGTIWEVWRYHYSDPELGEEHKILDENGNHVRELFSTNRYRMNPTIIVFNDEPPPPDDPQPPTEPTQPEP